MVVVGVGGWRNPTDATHYYFHLYTINTNRKTFTLNISFLFE